MKKKKYLVSFMIVVILLATSIGIYLSYPAIQSTISKETPSQSLITEYVASQIAQYNYAIDCSLKSKENSNIDTHQYLEIVGNSNIEGITSEIEDFKYGIKQSQRELEKETDIYYQATDMTTKKQISNTNDRLNSIQNDQALQKKYQWYVQIQFDQDGILFVNYSHNDKIQSRELNNYMIHQSQTYSEYNESNHEITSEAYINFKNPKNLTITYAVPEKLAANSNLSVYLTNYSTSDYLKYSMPYVVFAIAIIMLITLITPYQLFKEQKLLDVISRIKFGILAFMWCLVTGTLYVFSPYLIAATSQKHMIDFYQEFGIQNLDKILTPIINIGFWFIFFMLFVIFAYMIKYLFHKGFKNYCKENTCLGWIITNSQIILNKIVDFDFNDNINRSVLKIVLFNFVIISIISVFFVFGIFFSLVYSFIIFILLKKKFEDIQNDYQVLLNATRQLSNGNFGVKINEDVGVFNPLKDEFTHIKDGFEKAVNEEVKSQKMKTELISNVSHDLKTPLTSIITYIDLLKNDQLIDEDRKKYIEILERNSLRLKNLIDDLFEVSKVNSGNVHLDLVDVDIVSLIKQAQLESQDKLDEKNLDVRMNCSEEKIICYLDSSKTYRIFENLFINISKYALANTRVYIDLIQIDHQIQITFKNISEAEMTFNENEIVERFVQGDKSRNTSGSGLGLAIVKSFTELQKGQFKVEVDGDLFKSILTFNIKETS
ncbi:MAG: HAMP domain-containing sensor histidine kinase [Longibaculum muris]|uniref:histidine kinase n=1 Tax=Longibaculum muris TaxID=1796628 RepID=A0A4R3YIQ6_9FIRM|nr:HAMP domain-containing sensor histidine kinase [Longibaculum muris]KXU43814.1 histidine kinase A domain protein [Candidatus Stoquefichus sp. KLE1796]MBS5368738.1 HAMP domain-containing histidine kinase [Coprobacillus cateniformis]MCR1887752.1 HAMP domain-containing histidine kinase [Longibaculum muris]MED9810936.1 HAMP domain-containing sensor histidine kinase [Longibaculum muris]TCV92277.1 signal transduction histidine kinase [Longibaculum muris]